MGLGIRLVYDLAARQVVEILRRFSADERADILARANAMLHELEPKPSAMRRRANTPTLPARPVRFAEGTDEREAVGDIFDQDPFATGPTRPA